MQITEDQLRADVLAHASIQRETFEKTNGRFSPQLLLVDDSEALHIVTVSGMPPVGLSTLQAEIKHVFYHFYTDHYQKQKDCRPIIEMLFQANGLAIDDDNNEQKALLCAGKAPGLVTLAYIQPYRSVAGILVFDRSFWASVDSSTVLMPDIWAN